MLICIIGIDGSGKTTLAKHLVQEMLDRGRKSQYVWGGFCPTLLLRPLLWLAKRSIYREDRHSHVSAQKGPILKNKMVSTIYHHVVLADYVLQMLTRVGVPLLLGQTVVCDRYLHDTVANTAFILDYTDDKMLHLLKWMRHLIPRPDILLLADLPEHVAYARKDDVLSITFLSERRKRYLQIAEANDLTILDACQSADALAQSVMAEFISTLE
jgi:dTMP kinase